MNNRKKNSSLMRVVNQQETIETLLQIRKRILVALDFDFIINFDRLDNREPGDYADEEIAQGIRGINYRKEKEKINKFIEHREQVLADFKLRAEKAKGEYISLKERFRRADPGDPPKKPRGDSGNTPALTKYNEKAERYNNQLEIYKLLQKDQTKAKENYTKIFYEYENQKADFKEQLNQKNEKLESALADDIVICIDNLSKMAHKNITQRNHFFETFILILLGRKIYYFFSERVATIEKRMLTNKILEKLDQQLSGIIENHGRQITENLSYTIDYFYQCFRGNETLLEKIETRLRTIQHFGEDQGSKEIMKLISLPLDAKFEYHHVVDPDQLKKIEQAVEERKSQLQQAAERINKYIDIMEPSFQEIADVDKKCHQILKKMRENKNCKLDKLFFDIPFILKIFDQEEQDQLLWEYQGWLKGVREEIEKKYDPNFDSFIENAVETEILCKSTAQMLENNKALKFLSQKNALQEKREEVMRKITSLDDTLKDIQMLPQKRADEAKKSILKWLFLSIFPVINIGAFFPISSLHRKFLPVFSSGNSFYILLKESFINQFQVFLSIHILLTLLSGALALWVGKTVNVLFSFFTINYISCSAILGTYLKKVTSVSVKKEESKGGSYHGIKYRD